MPLALRGTHSLYKIPVSFYHSGLSICQPQVACGIFPQKTAPECGKRRQITPPGIPAGSHTALPPRAPDGTAPLPCIPFFYKMPDFPQRNAPICTACARPVFSPSPSPPQTASCRYRSPASPPKRGCWTGRYTFVPRRTAPARRIRSLSAPRPETRRIQNRPF